MLLDEPLIEGLMARDFPIAPDRANDILSAAMAVLEPIATVGVHSCADVDIATLLESGPQVLSLPVSSSLVPLVGYVERFLQHGGWIAWGAVTTEGPICGTPTRAWHQLSTICATWSSVAATRSAFSPRPSSRLSAVSPRSRLMSRRASAPRSTSCHARSEAARPRPS